MSTDWPERVALYVVVVGLYALIAIASVLLSRQSRHAGLTAAIAGLGLTFVVAKGQYGGYSGDFAAGAFAGVCLGVAGILGLATRMRRR